MFEKKLYIAKRIEVISNEYGEEIGIFENPKMYLFNYQPVNGYIEAMKYGEDIVNLYRAYISYEYLGKIKTGDIAYLIDGENEDIDTLAKNDNKYCNNANYRIRSVNPQNIKIEVVFERIKEKKYERI